MHDAGDALLISRIFMRTDLPYRALRVELAGESETAKVQAIHPQTLVDYARSLHADGVLFFGDGRTMAHPGVHAALTCLRGSLSCWRALVARGPHPSHLTTVLHHDLLDFMDVELAWPQTDEASQQTAIHTAPELEHLATVLCRSRPACIVRFTCPARVAALGRVSAAFDVFVRRSALPVAARMCETSQRAETRPTGSGQEELLEFVACRPAECLATAGDDWLTCTSNECREVLR